MYQFICIILQVMTLLEIYIYGHYDCCMLVIILILGTYIKDHFQILVLFGAPHHQTPIIIANKKRSLERGSGVRNVIQEFRTSRLF